MSLDALMNVLQQTLLGLYLEIANHSLTQLSLLTLRKQTQGCGYMQELFTKIIVMSPDTDVYLIGLPLFCASERDIIVQVSPIASSQLKLLHLKALVHALQNDPDLAHIDQKILPKVFQALYVVTGCDYISFFSQVGKASFMRYFYQYASFISSAREYPGTLADTCLSDGMYQQGYLAFLRLIGTVYFKKHCTGFDTQSPISHFQTFKDKGPDQHLSWLDNIRQNMWLVPSKV